MHVFSVDNLSTIFDRSRFSSSQAATILTELLGENNSKLKMAVEMTIPDYHNQSKLPTGVTISLWDDKSTIFNVDKIESRMLHPENYKDMAWAEALDDNMTYWFAADRSSWRPGQAYQQLETTLRSLASRMDSDKPAVPPDATGTLCNAWLLQSSSLPDAVVLSKPPNWILP
eukprot:g13387.t1